MYPRKAREMEIDESIDTWTVFSGEWRCKGAVAVFACKI